MGERISNGPAIEVSGLVKSFGKVCALDGVDLEVAAGTVLGVLGPNGAGKTTAVRVLTTLLAPDSGSARVLGLDVVEDAPALRAKIGLAGQYAAVDENLTGVENLVMVGRLYGMRRGDAKARAGELLDRFGLSDAGDRVVRTHSGGMRRRLDLAAALVARPPVLFLDEPTTGLDPRSRLELWETIEGLVADGTSDQLKDKVGGVRVEVHVTDPSAAAAAAAALAPMSGDEPLIEGSRVSVSVPRETGTIMEAARRLDQEGLSADDVAIRRPTLDDVFLTLTGRELSSEADEQADPDREEMPA